MREASITQSIILCEGFYDRAFCDGLLQHVGCSSLKPKHDEVVEDLFENPIARGKFGYSSKSSNFIIIEPAGNKDNVRRAAKYHLNALGDGPIARLIVNVDDDTNADGTTSASTTMNRQSIVDLVCKYDPGVRFEPDRPLEILGGATTIDLIRWHADDLHSDGLPNQQTLERLVCASIMPAYPVRGAHVHSWLDTSPLPPASSAKEHAWSYMAGWYAEHGCNTFYQLIW